MFYPSSSQYSALAKTAETMCIFRSVPSVFGLHYPAPLYAVSKTVSWLSIATPMPSGVMNIAVVRATEQAYQINKQWA